MLSHNAVRASQPVVCFQAINFWQAGCFTGQPVKRRFPQGKTL
jgi:hypothetical protein